MAEIRDIRNVEVRDINVPSWMTNSTTSPICSSSDGAGGSSCY